MKRLFSKTMLAALIISLIPAQSAQANPNAVRTFNALTSACVYGLVAYSLSKLICKSIASDTEKKVSGLDMLSNAASRNFDNHSFYSRNADGAGNNVQCFEKGAWTELTIQSTIAALRLPNERQSREDLVRKINSLRLALIQKEGGSARRKAITQTCKRHKEAIKTTAQRDITYTKFGLPIIGALFGFVYSWLGR